MLKRSALPISAAIVLLATASSAFACACCGTYKVTGVSSDDVLNVRSGPGMRYRTVGSIPSGSACVTLRGKCGRRWCPVSFADVKGWSARRYLRYWRGPR